MSNGITGMDLYRLFSDLWSARIDKDVENKTVFPDNGVHTDVVSGRSVWDYLRSMDMEITTHSKLYPEYFGNRNFIIL